MGAFLLITNFLWYFLPHSSIRDILHLSQIGLGFGLMIHGYYLASQEEAKMLDTFKKFFDRITGKGVSPDEYAEQHRRKKRDMR